MAQPRVEFARRSTVGLLPSGEVVKASRPLIRVLVINDNSLWINDFI